MWLRGFVLIALWGVLALPLSAREIVDLDFPDDAPQVTVPLTRAGALLFVPVKINDRDAGLFLLDTGASHLYLSRGVAQELGLRRVASGTFTGIGGTGAMEMHPLDSFSVGGVTMRRTFAGQVELAEIDDVLGQGKVRGVVGNSFLRHIPFRIDHRTATLTLYRRDRFKPPPRLVRHELRMMGRMPAVRITLEDAISGWFVLDTGSNAGIQIQKHFSQLHHDFIVNRPYQQRMSVGAGGVRVSRQIDLRHVDLLGTRVHEVEAAYGMVDETGISRFAAGHFGAQVLGQFEITFDYAGGVAWARWHGEVAPAEWEANDFDPNAPDLIGVTPLMRAARLPQIRDLLKFLSANVEVNARDVEEMTALHYAAESDRRESALGLLGHGAAVDIPNKWQATALHLASFNASPAMVQSLLLAEAEVNATDAFGRTPLILAGERGHVEIVAVLLQAGAEVNVVSTGSGAALHAASFHGHFEVMRALIEAGADCNIAAAGFNGLTPLIAASYGGNLQAVELLLDHGASIHGRNRDGQTALFAAAEQGNVHVARLLLQRGIDKNARDTRGRTALDYAVADGHLEVMTLLHFGSGAP